MPTAIIIGFEYSSLINDKPQLTKLLSGALFDIYRMYRWCRECNYKIFIITDITEVRELGVLVDGISSGKIEREISNFSPWSMDECKIVKNSSSLMESLTSIPPPEDNKLLIYYSGHGESEQMVMPNCDKLSFATIRDAIHTSIPISVEVFWILDCCESGNFDLPYKIVDNKFTLQDVNKAKFLRQNTFLVASAGANEKSISGRYGSIFTKKLLSVLRRLDSHEVPLIDKNRNLSRIMGEISSSLRLLKSGYHHTITVWSSYLNNPVLWCWIGSSKYNIKEIIGEVPIITITDK